MANSSSRQLHARVWAEACDLIDLQLSPLGMQAIEAPGLRPTDAVLDVGCGAGQTLVQLAERVGDDGLVIGVDVAPLLLDVARRRTEHLPHVMLIEADAQVVELPPQSVDAVFSRFGVMSFHDPVAAFANFHRLLRPRGHDGLLLLAPARGERAGLLSVDGNGIRGGGRPWPPWATPAWCSLLPPSGS